MDVTADQGRMAPSWDNGVVRLYNADARSIPLPDESVHCVVTSPPYWNLRDYGLAPSVWGGDLECPHYWSDGVVPPGARSSDSKSGSKQQDANRRDRIPTSACCGECGAWSGTLGLEPTVGLYVAHIVEIFREVWRVLRKDGTCWINLGDSYSGRREGDLKPKDLVMMPARVALALQADGWWLRSPVIWDKPNPMPESVRDRPTTAHEYVWLLSKSGALTYWTHRDLPGTRTAPQPDYRWTDRATGIEYRTEPLDWSDDLIDCLDCEGIGEITYTYGQASFFEGPPTLVKVCARCNHGDAETPGRIRRWKRINLWQGHDYFYDAVGSGEIAENARWPGVGPQHGKERDRGEKYQPMSSHNVRHAGTVWRIATRPFRGNHFATFPEDLPRRCIMAGTSEYGVCAECGAPWERCVERDQRMLRREPAHVPGNCATKTDSTGWTDGNPRTTGWQPTCGHDAERVPATVLDPFVGSGTTAVAAQKLGRRSVGVDASEEYLRLAVMRLGAVPLPLQLGGGG